MSSTRRTTDPKKVSYEKYMSAPEYAEYRPIPGNLVLPKAQLYSDPKVRELLFFLQSMSALPGGLAAISEQLVKWYPERCREDESREAATLRLAAMFAGNSGRADLSIHRRTTRLLAEYLTDLTLNPKLSLVNIEAPCFEDLGDALARFKTEYEKSVSSEIAETTNSLAVQSLLGQALTMSRMVVVEGPAGAGKSTSAKAWCAARSGRVRYVSLTGITNRITFFQKIGTAIGLATCQRKAQQLQTKIEEFFVRSKMMLVLDEAHYLWPQVNRPTGSPELIDWIDTALVNYRVPVALLCTDQFARLKNRMERQTGWTSEQFMHRVFRYRKLEERPTSEDVERVVKNLLSSAWDEGRHAWVSGSTEYSADSVKVLSLYALEQKIPFSCVASCIDEARSFARTAERSFVSKADLARALRFGQIPSDAALNRAFAHPLTVRKGSRTKGVAEIQGKPSRSFVRMPNDAPPSSQTRSLGAVDTSEALVP